MNRHKAIIKLRRKLANPDRRTIEENAPVIVMKNGKHVMVEEHDWLYGRSTRYRVSLDFGCTCREIGRADNLSELLDIVLSEA